VDISLIDNQHHSFTQNVPRDCKQGSRVTVPFCCELLSAHYYNK